LFSKISHFGKLAKIENPSHNIITSYDDKKTSNLDKFSSISDFVNSIQDVLSEVSKIEHDIKPILEKIRLHKIRSQYHAGLIIQSELESIWKKWRDQAEFMIIQNDDMKSIAMKCSKRGNDVYQYRIKERFKEIDMLSSDLDFNVFDPNDKNKKSNALFVTLTYDTKLKSSMQAWGSIGIEYNRFVSNLKRKFGKFSVIRCFESFGNGYPHVHMLILFDDKKFNVFEHFPTNDIMQGSTYRIKEKSRFESSWHSHVDVLAVNNMGQAINYITKYLRKTNNEDSPKYATTQSLLWINNKRSFSISGKFREMLESYRLEVKLHNSNKKLVQLTIAGEEIEQNWNFVGIFSLNEILSCNKIKDVRAWHFEIDNIPEKDKGFTLKNDDGIDKKLFSANRGVNYV